MNEQQNSNEFNPVSNRQKVWLFQANPNKYDIFKSLATEKEEYWNLNQHSKDIKVGDQILIWICGEEAGIYAIGTVISSPVKTEDSATGQGFWLSKSEGRLVKPRVIVRYDRILLDRPIYKAYLIFDPILRNLRVIQSPRGTNYEVTQNEWKAVNEWLKGSKPI